jgi:hypothetical protein
MLKTNGPVKNCWFTDNALPVDKICHLNPAWVCHPESTCVKLISVNLGISIRKFRFEFY